MANDYVTNIFALRSYEVWTYGVSLVDTEIWRTAIMKTVQLDELPAAARAEALKLAQAKMGANASPDKALEALKAAIAEVEEKNKKKEVKKKEETLTLKALKEGLTEKRKGIIADALSKQIADSSAVIKKNLTQDHIIGIEHLPNGKTIIKLRYCRACGRPYCDYDPIDVEVEMD